MGKTTFWSYKIFKNTPQIRISYQEIARVYGISLRSAKNYIKRDMSSGLIRRLGAYHSHPSSYRLSVGKNVYYLTPKGTDSLNTQIGEFTNSL